MKYILSIFLPFLPILLSAQSLTGSQLLDKTIAFHDPENQWPTAQIQLQLRGERPDGPASHQVVHIDLPNSYFGYEGNEKNMTIQERPVQHGLAFICNTRMNLLFFQHARDRDLPC